MPTVRINGRPYEEIAVTTRKGVPLDVTSGLEIPAHDFIGVTYVAAGNGVGEIYQVFYKEGGSGGTTVATLTLSYDANNRLSGVTRS